MMKPYNTTVTMVICNNRLILNDVIIHSKQDCSIPLVIAVVTHMLQHGCYEHTQEWNGWKVMV